VARGYREPGEKPRRFYTSVTLGEAAGGFTVLLDDRGVKTPGGKALVVPTRALAELVAADWAGQGESLILADMHAARLANTAVDAIPSARTETAAQFADYAGSDLLCYRATAPDGLVERQTRLWDPVLARMEAEEAIGFVRVAGIIHQPQPAPTLERMRALALGGDEFTMAGLAFAASLFGSAVLAVSLMRGWITAQAAHDLSRLDEAFQEELWGVDAEAAERTERMGREAAMLGAWFRALGAVA
jgi:chaperone required for assembly of F1-ATPase